MEPVFQPSAPSSAAEIISFQLSSFQRQPLSFGKWWVIPRASASLLWVNHKPNGIIKTTGRTGAGDLRTPPRSAASNDRSGRVRHLRTNERRFQNERIRRRWDVTVLTMVTFNQSPEQQVWGGLWSPPRVFRRPRTTTSPPGQIQTPLSPLDIKMLVLKSRRKVWTTDTFLNKPDSSVQRKNCTRKPRKT